MLGVIGWLLVSLLISTEARYFGGYYQDDQNGLTSQSSQVDNQLLEELLNLENERSEDGTAETVGSNPVEVRVLIVYCQFQYIFLTFYDNRQSVIGNNYLIMVAIMQKRILNGPKILSNLLANLDKFLGWLHHKTSSTSSIVEM